MSSSSCSSTNRTNWYRHNISLLRVEGGGGGRYGTSGCVTGLRGDLSWGFKTISWSSCVTKIQEPLRGLWGCFLQCTMTFCRDWHQPLSSRPPTGEHPLNQAWMWTSKLWIGKCEDQPCAAALYRASDNAEPRLPVIRQCSDSGTTVLHLWSTRAWQCYRRDAATVSCCKLQGFFPRSNTCELLFSLTHSMDVVTCA